MELEGEFSPIKKETGYSVFENVTPLQNSDHFSMKSLGNHSVIFGFFIICQVNHKS